MSAKTVALVTGIAGFCGTHLALHLLVSGYEVIGLDQRHGPVADLTVHEQDITDTKRLKAILSTVQPDVIFHLAALTNPRLKYDELHGVNALGTLSLLDAVHEACPDAAILVTSSSAVYGHVPTGVLISEEQDFHPMNAYAVSKIAQEMVAYQQFAEHGLHVIRTRTFNIAGPGESPNFVTSAFAQQIAEIEAGLREPVINVGNLEAVRDYTDVRDAIRAYGLLVQRGEPGEVYNVSSGQGVRIRQLLDILLDLSCVHDISIRLDPSRLQPTDVPSQVGDATRLRSVTGWSPTIPLRQTLKDVLDFWRQRIHVESPGASS
jgi:GDP-4-dehydro-6-deoxy-D-mannose reductase